MKGTEERIRKIIQSVVNAAIDDHHEWVNREVSSSLIFDELRNPQLRGSRLSNRLALDKIRVNHSRGDSTWYREIYHATRLLMATEDEVRVIKLRIGEKQCQ